MPLSHKQTGVRNGALPAAIATLAVVMLSAMLNPFHFAADLGLAERLTVVAQSALLPGFALVYAIGRLANHRFSTPDAIDAAVGPAPSDRVRVLQAQLQNTLEQVVIAVIAYAAWGLTMPAAWLSAVPAVAITFLVGRAAFIFGYERGAGGRAFGFGLTFYPTMFMFALLALRIGETLIGSGAH